MSNYPLSSSHLEKEGRYLSSLYIEFKMADGGKESETRNTTLDHRKSTEKTKIKYVSCDKILHDSRSLESLPPSAVRHIEKTLRTRLFHFLRDFIKMRVTEERVTCKNFFFFPRNVRICSFIYGEGISICFKILAAAEMATDTNDSCSWITDVSLVVVKSIPGNLSDEATC